jgi:hypothetical protein
MGALDVQICDAQASVQRTKETTRIRTGSHGMNNCDGRPVRLSDMLSLRASSAGGELQDCAIRDRLLVIKADIRD